MSTSDSAACAIGALRADGGAPGIQGSGLAVGKDAASSKYYLSSCAHVYNQIKKLHTDGVVVGGVTKVLPGAYLDPSVHGVAIGFSSGSGGPIRWLENAAGDGFARATVAHADGGPLLFEPPSTHTPDGLDLVVLQLEASEPLHMLTLANEPLKQGEDMTLKGFGVPAGGMNVILRPVFCKFSVLNPRGASNPSGPWIESDLDDQPGHSGGPLLNTKDQAVGWCVRSRPTYQQGIAIPSGRSEVRPIALLKEKLDTIVGIQMPAPVSGTPQNAATVNDILVQNLHLAAVLDAVCPNDPQPDNNSERLEKLRAAVDAGAIFAMKTDKLKLALGVLGFTALSGKAKAQLQTLFQQALRNGPAEPKSAKKKKLQKPGAPEVDVLTPTSVRVKWTPATGCDAIKYTVTLTPQKSDTLEYLYEPSLEVVSKDLDNPGDDTQLDFEDLDPGVEYQVTVTAEADGQTKSRESRPLGD